jgi:LmbE family N-acetylglucosaminyl deacetylase
MKDLFIVAHPDDAEVMLGHAIAASQDPFVVVASNGEASAVDMRGDRFCPVGQTSS